MSSINSRVPPLRLMAVDTPTDGQLPSYQSSSGQFEWVDDSSGGTPGTPAQAIQFNSDPAGTFTGSSRLLYDNSSNDSIIEMSSGLATTMPIIKSTGGRGLIVRSTSNDNSNRNCLKLFGESDAPDGIGLFPASGLYVQVGDSTTTPAKITTRGSGANLELTTNLTDDKAKVTLIAGSNGNVEIQTEGTGSTEIKNATTNQASQLLIRGNGTGVPKLQMTNDTKAITLQCDENNKVKVAGSLYNWVLDASSATGGITFPDGTTQITAATGGGDANFITDATLDFSTSTLQAYNLYWPFYPTAKYSQPTASTAASSASYTYGYPFVAQSTGNITGLSVRCTTSGTDLFHVAIYATDDDLWPTTLVGLGKFDCSTTGAKRVTTFYETDGTTTTNISLTTGDVYWVLYSNIGGDTSLPTLGSTLDATYHISTIGTNSYSNGGGYNPRGTIRFRLNTTQGTTTTTVFPASYTNYSTIYQARWNNSSSQAMPIWVGVD